MRKLFLFIVAAIFAAKVAADSISCFDQHFNEPGSSYSPWIFIPAENVAKVSTIEHPGLALVTVGKEGKDIKGVLKSPIKINDFKLPWQFQCSWIQSFDAMTGRAQGQVNYAMGVNLALTFSNPQNWPQDRNQRPDETHDLQLFVVHLGNYGEVGKGLPQLQTAGYPSPETYLVYGRGDIAGPAKGDWKIPNIWIGDGARYGGPASNQIYYRVVIESKTQIAIGIKFDASHGWNMRNIDVSKYGEITGVWEIGPIISADRWIQDVLAKEMDIKPPPPVSPPDLSTEYFLDYCVFWGTSPIPFEEHSDEFNIPGYMGKWQIQEQSTIVEVFSHPGYMTITLLGPGMGTCFGHAGVSNLSLLNYPPPWEIELCFIPPDSNYPWNLYINFGLYDNPFDDPHWLKLLGKENPKNNGKLVGYWHTGIQNTRENGLQPMSTRSNPAVNVEFEKPVPKSILESRPVRMLVQVIDETHVRLGYKGKESDPWYFSKVHDLQKSLGSPVKQFGPHHAYSICTDPKWGGQDGLPAYQQFLIDYVRYRYGLTDK